MVPNYLSSDPNYSYITPFPKYTHWFLQMMGALMLSFLSLPAYANDDKAMLQFFMQGGSIMYVLFLAYFIISNSKARMTLFVIYLSLTVIGYLVAISTTSEFNILLTIFICIFIPLVTTIILAFIIAMREN